MASEQVILEFTGDASGLKPVADALMAIGQISKEQYDAFNKANATAAGNMAKLTAETQKTVKGVSDLNKGAKELSTTIAGGAIKEATKAVQDFGAKIVDADNKSKSLKAQLKAMKEELTLMEEAGQGGSEAFIKLSVEAAKLEDRIGDTSRRIRALASDTAALDGLVSVATGAVGAFTALQGAAALFGDENKDLQKGILKLQAAMSLLTGIQAFAAAVNKDSAATQLIFNARQAIGTAVTKLDTVAKGENVIASTLAAGAIRVLNVVMAANPALLVAGAVLALGAALFALSGDSKEAIEQQKELNKTLDEEKFKIQALEVEYQLAQGTINEFQASRLKAQIELNKQINDINNTTADKLVEQYSGFWATLKASFNLQLKGWNGFGKDVTAIINKSNTDKQSLIDIFNEQQIVDNANHLKALEDQLRDSEIRKLELLRPSRQNDILIEQKKFDEEILNASKDLNDKDAKLRKAAADLITSLTEEHRRKQNDINDKWDIIDLQKQKKHIEAGLSDVKTGSDAELNIRLDAIEKQRQIDVAGAKGDAVAIADINRVAANAALDLQIANLQKRHAAAIASEKEFLQVVADAQAEVSEKRLQANLKLIEIEQQAKLAAANDIEDVVLHNQAVVTANQDAANKTAKVWIDYYARLHDLRQKDIDDQANQEIFDLQLVKENVKLSEEAHFKASQEIFDKQHAQLLATRLELKNHEEEVLKNQEISDAAKIKLHQETADKIRAIDNATAKNEQDKANEAVAHEKEVRNQIVDVIQQAATAVFQVGAQYRQAALDADLKRLEDLKQKELDNKNLTESQKAAINKKYAKLEADEKRRAWAADKQAKIAEAVIDTALAIIKAAPNPVLIELASALGAISIGIIAAQPVPQFAKGTAKAPAGMKWVGEQGPELINDRGGYAIMTNKDSMALMAKYKIPALPDNSVTMPLMDGAIMQNYVSNHTGIDYDRLAAAIGDKLKDSPRLMVHIDKAGMQIRTMEKGRIVHFLNGNYHEK